jgi:hypothetical protein
MLEGQEVVQDDSHSMDDAAQQTKATIYAVATLEAKRMRMTDGRRAG